MERGRSAHLDQSIRYQCHDVSSHVRSVLSQAEQVLDKRHVDHLRLIRVWEFLVQYRHQNAPCCWKEREDTTKSVVEPVPHNAAIGVRIVLCSPLNWSEISELLDDHCENMVQVYGLTCDKSGEEVDVGTDECAVSA